MECAAFVCYFALVARAITEIITIGMLTLALLADSSSPWQLPWVWVPLSFQAGPLIISGLLSQA